MKGSFDKGLVFDRSKSTILDILGYVNSNYVADLDCRRPISYYIFTLRADAIFWKMLFNLLQLYLLLRPSIWLQLKM